MALSPLIVRFISIKHRQFIGHWFPAKYRIRDDKTFETTDFVVKKNPLFARCSILHYVYNTFGDMQLTIFHSQETYAHPTHNILLLIFVFAPLHTRVQSPLSWRMPMSD